MRALLLAACLASTAAAAETSEKYDRALEQSVMKIVASKMGELRGGFGFADKPVLIGAMQPPVKVPAGDWVDGLAPARQHVIAPIDAMM